MARWVRWNNPTIKPPFGAQIDWSNPITEGLVGCWLFNELQGDIYNLTNPEEKGTLYGNTKWINNYCYFDGDQDYILDASDEISNNIPRRLAGSTKYTITLCIKSFATGVDRGIFTNYNPTTQADVGLQLRYDEVGFESEEDNCFKGSLGVDTTDDFTFETEGGLQSTNWQHISVVRNVSNVKFFLDAIEKSIAATTNPSSSPILSSDHIYLGVGTKNYWYGYIKYIHFWNRAISSTEIEQLYHEPYSFFLYPQYWYLVDFGGINSIEYSSLYDILNKNEYNNKYDIQAKTEKNIKYDLLAQNSYVSEYDILTKKETDIGYDILTKAEYSIIYDILFAKEYNSKYDLLNSLTTSILYNILNKNEYNVLYDILGTTAIEYTIKYDILNSAQTNIVFDILSKKEASIKYDILISRTSNIVYDILAKTLTNIIYDILTKKETTFLYDIINKKEINFKYDILTAKNYTSIYNILTKSEYKILYDILSDIIIKPEIVFKVNKQNTIFKAEKINTIFILK